MDANNLIHMANRIGEFFEAMPDREEALQGIAEHIHKFWEPRMRGRLQTVLEQVEEAQLLRPIVKEALLQHGCSAQGAQR